MADAVEYQVRNERVIAAPRDRCFATLVQRRVVARIRALGSGAASLAKSPTTGWR